ncbi:proline-rich domain-containing protein [Neobacillus drentensis]|uniref:proline-rich domain-containing protein n=1 Tax=Neobacillus drentensis TaxID=220684 RepID=UPI002FFDBD81
MDNLNYPQGHGSMPNFSFENNLRQSPPYGGGHQPPSHGGGHQPPPHGGGHQPPSHGGGHQPPPHGGGHQPPPHGGGHQPPPHGGGHQPPPFGGGHQPPPFGGGHQPPPYEGGYHPPYGGGPHYGGAPTAPPPTFIPHETVGLYAVDPGGIRHCLYRYTYVWLNNGRSFWYYPTYVGRTSIAGYRWRGYYWDYYGMDLNRIRSFSCH